MLQFMQQVDETAKSFREAISREPPGRRLYIPLPPQNETTNLLRVFLDEVNATLPIFQKESLVAIYERQFPVDRNSEEPAWWACLNAILAIATQRKATNDAFRMVSKFSWAFFKNAFSVLDEIISTDPSLLAVQALLVMAVFLRGTVDTRTLAQLVSVAARMIRIISLDREPAGVDVAETEQRRRVFWIAYMLDIDSSINSGLPPNLERGYHLVALPSQTPHDGLGILDISANLTANLFRLTAELRLIKAKAHRLIDLDAAMLPMHGKLEGDISQLPVELETWRQKVPEAIRPEGLERPVIGTVVFPLAILQLEFYSTTSMIHRALVSEAGRRETLGATPDLGQVALYAKVSTDACRAGVCDCTSTSGAAPGVSHFRRVGFQICFILF